MPEQTVTTPGYPQEGDLVRATALTVVGPPAGPYTGAKLRLFKSTFVPNLANIRADFVAQEAVFTGYPAGGTALTYSAASLAADGTIQIPTNRLFFQATDAVLPQIVGGFWIESGTKVLDFVRFNTPVNMNAALLFCAITCVIGMRGLLSADVDN